MERTARATGERQSRHRERQNDEGRCFREKKQRPILQSPSLNCGQRLTVGGKLSCRRSSQQSTKGGRPALLSGFINGQNPTLWELNSVAGLSSTRARSLDQRHDKQRTGENKTDQSEGPRDAAAFCVWLTGRCHVFSFSAALYR